MVKKSKKKNFKKYQTNQYVLIQYSEWTSNHPHAIIIDTIGEITTVNTIRYLLYTKNIPTKSFAFKAENFITKDKNIEQLETVFSIDPIGSRDLDDALSIRKNGTQYIVTTHIRCSIRIRLL